MNNPIFILSTGRTGTQFFEDYINQTSDSSVCKHEPKPSRRFKFLSNLYLEGKVSDNFVTSTYQFSRKSLFREVGNKIYVESNNFIFGCIPALNQYYRDIKIIHIVRHPFNYIESHMNHGFWRGHKKLFAKYAPFWLENIDVNDRSNPVELLSARWNFVNNHIASYSDKNDYINVRFEDLFYADLSHASDNLNGIRAFCDLRALSEAANGQWLRRPKNYSNRNFKLTATQKRKIKIENENLMRKYDYNE